jgi:hypothetical protein
MCAEWMEWVIPAVVGIATLYFLWQRHRKEVLASRPTADLNYTWGIGMGPTLMPN